MTETLPERRTGHRIAWAVTALWGAWAVARLTGADRIPVLNSFGLPLIALTPYAAAASVVPIGVAAALRAKGAALVAGGVALVFAGLLLPRAVGATPPPASGPELRVMSANLQFGRSDMDELARYVRENRVDVLSLQEFTLDARDGLARAGLHAVLPYSVLAPEWGAAGTGLYSRYPLTELPPIPGTIMHMPRASLDVAGRTVQVTAVHPNPPINPQQVDDWRHTYGKLPAPATDGAVQILAGDFNSTLDHALFRELLGRGYTDAADATGKALIPTWGLSMGGPPLTLDHVLVPEKTAVRSYAVHSLTGSDHRVIVTTVQLP